LATNSTHETQIAVSQISCVQFKPTLWSFGEQICSI
jgi:hypothetical protein